MVHKKYTYKNGKRYGPYLYETKRVGGKIVTTYLGSAFENSTKDSKRTINLIPILLILGLVLVISFLFLYFPIEFTGRATLDVQANYEVGELITGNLNLTSVTSVPADATGIVGYVKGDVVAIDPKESTEVGPIQPDQTVSLFVCIQDHTSTQDPRFKKEYWVEDQCSKTLHACKMRFGDWAEEQPTKGGIPFGGFPSIEAYRYTN